MSTNRSFFLIKPDGIKRKLNTAIFEILQEHGILVVNSKRMIPDVNHWKQHYIEHEGKEFYEELCQYMANKPVLAMEVATESKLPCWEICRKILGSTDPSKADKGTIRNLYGTSVRKNVGHGSDSKESAERELKLWGFDV